MHLQSIQGMAPLQYISLIGQFDVAKLLIEKGADVNATVSDLLNILPCFLCNNFLHCAYHQYRM